MEIEELLSRLVQDLVGLKLTHEELELLTSRFEQMLEDHRRLSELDFSQEEPIVAFSREREP